MFPNPFIFIENRKADLVLTKKLLHRQGLALTPKSVFHCDILDLIDQYPLIFRATSYDLLNYAKTLPQKDSRPPCRANFPSSMLLKDLENHCIEDFQYQNIYYLNLLSKLTASQLKIFTIFNGKLTSQKLGPKSKNRVSFYANEDHQYVLLTKISPSSSNSLLSSSTILAPSVLNSQSSSSARVDLNAPGKNPSPKSGTNYLKSQLEKQQNSEWSCFIDEPDSGLAFACCKFTNSCDASVDIGDSTEIPETSASSSTDDTHLQKSVSDFELAEVLDLQLTL